MRQELDEALVKDFPNLFADRFGNMQSTAMCWGFEVGDGWEPLIRRLAEKLDPICKQIKDEMTPEALKWYGGGPRASQVKEKYATLRFYMNTYSDEMEKLINEAERESEVTCEQCGKPGECRGTGWLYTACDEHTQERDK